LEYPTPDSCRAAIICQTIDHRGDLGASVTRNNVLYLIIGVLAIIFAAITYHLYWEHKLPGSVHFHLGPNGLSIEKD
jgi:hypothetical protein